MRKLDVLFVHTSTNRVYQSLRSKFSCLEPPTWSLLLAQSCRAKGFGVDLLDCDADNLSDEEAVKKIKEANPRLVVFAVYGSEPNQGTVRMAGAVPLARLLKNTHPEIKICFTGSHTQAEPIEVLTYPFVDFVLPSEGVYALRNLLSTDLEDVKDIKGIGWKRDSETCDGPSKSMVINGPEIIVPQDKMNVDLPGYAWDLVDFSKYRSHFWHSFYDHSKRSPFAALYTSIGCFAKCDFCWREGTVVTVANGKNKKIEDITREDTLVAFDTDKNEVVETKIVAIGNRWVDDYLSIRLGDGKTLEVTDEHPLYRRGEWIKAMDIHVGDELLVIENSDKLSLYRKLYNPTRSKNCREKIAASKMGERNPMKRKEVSSKVSTAMKKNWADGTIMATIHSEEAIQKRAESMKKFYGTEEGKELRNQASQRMKNRNPMADKEVARKKAETTSRNIADGSYIPWMCTEEGRKTISRIAKVRQKGETNSNWKGGSSLVNYPSEFNNSLRSIIKKRDNYTCQLCGFYGKGGKLKTGRRMSVHHIDYDKKNSAKCNLILLCNSCHSKTNTNNDKRRDWTSLFNNKILEAGHTECPHYVKVVSVSRVKKRTRVYNFQCSPYNNYFANLVLGHNCMINIVNRSNYSDGISAADSAVFRYWHPEQTLREIDTLVSRGVRTIRISDEMFVYRRQHFEPILTMIKERYGDSLNLWCYARADTIRPRDLKLFRDAGVHWICLGIESGNQTVRREVSKGSYVDTDVRNIVKEIEDHGIDVIANFICGLPSEDHAKMQESLDLAISLNCRMFNLYPAMALPGSPLYVQAKKEGKKLPDSYEAFGFLSYECQPLGTEHLTPAEVLDFRDKAFHTYWDRPEFQKKVEEKFGDSAVSNIRDMLKIRLKRKLLGDTL